MEEQITEQTERIENEEIVLGIPKNAALIKISVLCMMPDGTLGEVSGRIDVEQIGIARARFLQLQGSLESSREEGGNEEEERSTKEASGEREEERVSEAPEGSAGETQ